MDVTRDAAALVFTHGLEIGRQIAQLIERARQLGRARGHPLLELVARFAQQLVGELAFGDVDERDNGTLDDTGIENRI